MSDTLTKGDVAVTKKLHSFCLSRVDKDCWVTFFLADVWNTCSTERAFEVRCKYCTWVSFAEMVPQNVPYLCMIHDLNKISVTWLSSTTSRRAHNIITVGLNTSDV